MRTVKDVLKVANVLMAKEFTVTVNRVTITTSANKLGYTFKFDNAKTRLGRCAYGPRVISLSNDYVVHNVGERNDDIIDTILHEIAHAISHHGFNYYGHHGTVWQRVAKQVGARPETRTKANLKRGQSKYTLVCNNCGKKSQRHRLASESYSCGSCCRAYNGGKYTDIYKMQVIQNH